MLFNSWGYVFLMLLAVPLHWALPNNRWRQPVLCVLSLAFYAMWRWDFTLLVVFSAVVDYVCSLFIGATQDPRRRKAWLLVSLVINFSLLIGFKYTYFLWDNVRVLAGAAGLELPPLQDMGVDILLPLGISFYTFQTVSYTVDCYRGVIRPTKDFVLFLTYVMFWPQLIAGPVLRADEVIPGLLRERRWNAAWGAEGVALVVAGLFKKVVLADNLSPLVDEAFALPAGALTAPDTWVANALFGFQIYFDFSGYSDIAIGSALLLGLRFPDNFDWPYMARSPREFWARWHISLSSWIRDYLYLPLTGERFQTHSTGGIAVAAGTPSRASESRRNGALLLTWFIMGLWHGAAWTFALWGLYHATLILLYRLVKPLRELPERFPVLAWLVMLPLAMAGWIAFRAQDMSQALAMFGRILTPSAYTLRGRGVDMYAYFWAAAITAGMTALWLLRRRARDAQDSAPVPRPVLAVSLAVMTFAVLLCMRQVKQFIYFQF
jgi:D-alanyl-lipoteichoic acid acyltransferase DltB (MBOAT superfamily)